MSINNSFFHTKVEILKRSRPDSFETAEPPRKQLRTSELVLNIRKRPRSDSCESPHKKPRIFQEKCNDENISSIQQIGQQTLRLSSTDRRFLPPRALGPGAPFLGTQAPANLTLHQQRLSNALFQTNNPWEAPVFLRSSQLQAPSLTPPRPDPHPLFIPNGWLDAPSLQDDCSHQAIAYSQATDCLGLLMDDQMAFKKGSIVKAVPFDEYPPNPPTAIAFSPDGHSAVVNFLDGRLSCYQLNFLPHEIECCEVWNIRVNPGFPSPLLVSDAGVWISTAAGQIRCFDRVYETLLPNPITGMTLSPNQKSLLVADAAGTIHLFDLELSEFLDLKVSHPVSSFQAFNSAFKALAFSPCGNYFVAGGGDQDCRVSLFKIQKGQILLVAEQPISSPTTSIFWEDQLVLSTHADGSVHSFLAHPQRELLSAPKRHLLQPNGFGFTYATLKRGEETNNLIAACPKKEVLISFSFKPYGRPEKNKPFSSIHSSSTFNPYATVR